MTALGSAPTVPFVPGAAEALFCVAAVSGDPDRTTGTMQTGAASTGPDGGPCSGALGVLVDDVLGYAVVAARPAGHWAVSVEMFLDFCGPLPGPGEGLRAESRAVTVDASGGLAEGRVLDAAGAVVASCSQRMLFVPGEPDGLAFPPGREPSAHAPGVVPPGTGIVDLLGAHLRREDDGAALDVALTDRLANPVGNLHGGVLACLSELAGRHALGGSASPLATSSLHITFVRPVSLHQALTLAATVQYRGRGLGVASVTSRNAAGKVCSIATVTGRAAP
jgi:uncharacterized protein (TIGR00369 family)